MAHASLIACTECRRHVRTNEPTCPFCGVTRSPSDSPPREASPSAPTPPITRTLMMGFGIATGAALTAAALLGSACAMYGAPAYGGPPPRYDAGSRDDAETSASPRATDDSD